MSVITAKSSRFRVRQQSITAVHIDSTGQIQKVPVKDQEYPDKTFYTVVEPGLFITTDVCSNGEQICSYFLATRGPDQKIYGIWISKFDYDRIVKSFATFRAWTVPFGNTRNVYWYC